MKTNTRHPSRSGPVLGLTILALLSGQANAALTHHWAFDEGSGAIAGDSAGANDGAINGATWSSDGVRSSFLNFGGTDNNVDPNLTLAAQTNSSSFTWASWVNVGAGNGNHVILGNRQNGEGADYAPRQFIKFTVLQFEWHQNGNGNDNVNYDDLTSNGWQHLAVVKNGTSIETYLDGVSTGTGTLSESLDSAVPMRFFMGGEPGQGAGEHFTGGLDDVRIYDNALSGGEIAALAAGVPEPSSFLLAALGLGAGCLRRKR